MADVTIFSQPLRERQSLAVRVLSAALSQGKLPNAYLFVGRGADDKWLLCRQLVSYLNCLADNKQGGSCLARELASACLNCQWIAAGSHPQAWQLVEGAGRSQKIPVEKVRQLTDELTRTSNFQRAVVIPEAEEGVFHRPAANALLKSIEEPPENCLFLLFAGSADEVLSTIVSRCQVVPVGASLESGLWQNQRLQGHPAQSAIQEKLHACRADLILESRRAANAWPANATLKIATDAIELSKKLVQLGKELQDLADADICYEQIIDLVAACQLQCLSAQAQDQSATAAYLSALLAVSETAKTRLNHYVKPQTVLETFSFDLCELRQKYSGEKHLAIR